MFNVSHFQQNSTDCSNALGILLHECSAHILKQMLKRLKGRVYNAVVQALEKTTTKNNWQRLIATLTAIVPPISSVREPVSTDFFFLCAFNFLPQPVLCFKSKKLQPRGSEKSRRCLHQGLTMGPLASRSANKGKVRFARATGLNAWGLSRSTKQLRLFLITWDGILVHRRVAATKNNNEP